MMDARTVQSHLTRIVNRVGAPLGPNICLDPQYLMDLARRATGLEDFGDSGFETPLGVLANSWDKDARLHLVGRIIVQRWLRHNLINRLKIEEYFRRNPQTALVPVPDPVVITGAPRSGTTLLQRLFAADLSNRTLRHWELSDPVPKGYAPFGENDPRPAAAARHRALRRRILLSAAGRKAASDAHRAEASDAAECWPLLQNSFMSEISGTHGRVDGYIEWLWKQDLTPAYRYHRRQIQLLTAARPASRLVLKHPGHLGYIDDLLQVYPNARIVWLHRDPVETIASMCNLCALARANRTDSLDPEHIGASVVVATRWRFDRGVQARERHAPGQFLDVQYRDLTRDPIATAARIYDWLGFPLTAEVQTALELYMQRNRQERRGHRTDYNLATFGLDAATLRTQFRDYCERFQIGAAGTG